MINLKNKSIVVTGGTRGIGAEITKTFLRHNAAVFILARQKPKKLIQAKGNKAIFVECDIRDVNSIDAAVKKPISLRERRTKSGSKSREIPPFEIKKEIKDCFPKTARYFYMGHYAYIKQEDYLDATIIRDQINSENP